MRKLMWFAIGFAAACALFAYVLPAGWTTGLGWACFVISILSGMFGRMGRLYKRLALLLLGCAMGAAAYGSFHAQYLAAVADMNGETLTVTVRTTDYSEETNYGTAVDGVLEREGKRYRLRLWLDRKDALEPGYLLTGPFRFRMTAPAEDPVSWYSGNGVFLVASQTDELTLEKDPQVHWTDQIARLRFWLKGAIHASFPEDTEGFARALLLGDTSLLDYETDTNFKVSGIRHVVAVSGLHVSVLMALLSAVTFRRKYLMVPVGLGILLLFAALAGFTPSVNRSCIMSALLLLGLLFNRQYDGATALSFAVLVMLLANPLTVASVSFQLSVASVAGIYLIDPKLRPWLQKQLPDPGASKGKLRFVRWFSASVSITLSTTVFTTPLCACYFGMVSLVGVLTNLLALWVVSGIFYGIMAVCVLYAVSPSAAMLLGKAVALPIRYVLAVARMLADVPMAAVYLDSVYNVLWIIFAYLLLILFLLKRSRGLKQLLCCALLSLCAAQLASWNEQGEVSMTVLDVGQGQCIILQSEGRTCMVDCGGDDDSRTADIAANFLLSRGIERLDCLIVTHLDRDHFGGVENVLSRIETDLLILPAEHSQLSAGETVYAAQDLELRFEDTVITVFAPTFPGTGNEKSLCVLFDTEKCDILITGDRDAFGERMLLRSAHIPEVDILIAGHHGSKTSTCPELLEAASPQTVCISVGDNPYGLPSGELLKRLMRFGCTVYRTDLHGTVTIRR